jgi:hypothetical protein
LGESCDESVEEARAYGTLFATLLTAAIELVRSAGLVAAACEVVVTLVGLVVVLPSLLGRDVVRDMHDPALALAWSAFGVLVVTCVLVGPLAAFSLAASHQSVVPRDVIRVALKQGPWLLALLLAFAAVSALTLFALGWLVDPFVNDNQFARLFAAFLAGLASVLVASFLVLDGAFVLVELMEHDRTAREAFVRTRRLGRTRRPLALFALLAAAVPIVAGSASAFGAVPTTGGYTISLGIAGPTAGVAAAAWIFALLAVAAHRVASGETGD